MVYVSRKEHFNASHRLYNPRWTDERNQAVFGPCANPHGHGHNFELIVTVRGEPDPDTGFVMDLRLLSELIRTLVIEPVDHRNINVDVPFMRGKMASCEVLVMEFWKLLAPAITRTSPRAQLHGLKLFETPRNYVAYYGD